MYFGSRSCQIAACCILTLTIIPFGSRFGFPQTLQNEHTYPTRHDPRIVITNAYEVSITTWVRREVYVSTEVSGPTIRIEEVKIRPDTNKLEITCEPSKPDRNISLNLRVPANASLELRSNGNRIEVKQPTGQIKIVAARDSIQLNAPEGASLDMQSAPNAVEHRQLGPGSFARIGIGNRRSGSGPPFLKVIAPFAQVITSHGYVAPVNPTVLYKRNPTIAATTIARRNSSMSRALSRSHPELIRTRRDQPPAVNSQEPEEGALKLETHLVNLNIAATDKSGKAVPDLKQEDFIIYEDGVKQQTSFFSSEKAPLNLVLLIDLSGSVKDEIELIKETALHFLDVISVQDSVAIVTFTTDVTVISHLTKDREDLRESIDWMLAPSGGTAFYDALGYVLVEEFRKVKVHRNAVIAITDGEDNILQARMVEKLRPGGWRGPVYGSFLSYEELLEGATESDALIYPIHVNPTPSQPITPATPSPLARTPPLQVQVQPELTEIARKQLRELAEASGGRFYHANRISDLKGVFEQVAAELRTVYSIAYTPTNTNYDGHFRRIKVQVSKPDVVIRTRPGFYGR